MKNKPEELYIFWWDVVSRKLHLRLNLKSVSLQPIRSLRKEPTTRSDFTQFMLYSNVMFYQLCFSHADWYPYVKNYIHLYSNLSTASVNFFGNNRYFFCRSFPHRSFHLQFSLLAIFLESIFLTSSFPARPFPLLFFSRRYFPRHFFSGWKSSELMAISWRLDFI